MLSDKAVFGNTSTFTEQWIDKFKRGLEKQKGQAEHKDKQIDHICDQISSIIELCRIGKENLAKVAVEGLRGPIGKLYYCREDQITFPTIIKVQDLTHTSFEELLSGTYNDKDIPNVTIPQFSK